MTAIAGYRGRLSVGGTSTAFTAQACANVTGNTYRVSNAARRLLDPAVARVWKDGGSAIAAAGIVSEDLLFGTVTLAAPPSGSVTLDASYVPKAAVADVTSLDVEEKLDLFDRTSMDAGGHRTFLPTLSSATGSVTLLDNLLTDLDPGGAVASWDSIRAGRLPALIEFDPDANGTYVFRAWALLDDTKRGAPTSGAMTGVVAFSSSDRGSAKVVASSGWGAP